MCAHMHAYLTLDSASVFAFFLVSLTFTTIAPFRERTASVSVKYRGCLMSASTFGGIMCWWLGSKCRKWQTAVSLAQLLHLQHPHLPVHSLQVHH
jgi:hypothetical protein